MPIIEIDLETYTYIASMKSKYGTLKNTVKQIIKENIKLKKIKIELKSQIKNEQDFIKQAHLASVSRPIIVGQSQAQMSLNAPPSPPPPFRPTTLSDSKQNEILEGRIIPTFNKELKKAFKNNKLKPSEVCSAKFEEPKYLEIVED